MNTRRRLSLAVTLLIAGPVITFAGVALSGTTLVGLALVYVGLAIVRPLVCDPTAGATLDDVSAAVAADRSPR